MTTYAERPWTRNYDPGVPTSLEPYPQVPLHRFLEDSARKSPDNIALVTNIKLPLFGRVDSTLTYRELDQLADALAVGLVNMGLKKGERVALVMPNIAAFAISFYAILKAGGVVAAANPTYPAEKLQQQLDDCDCEIVITMSMFYKVVKQVQAQTKIKKVIVTNIKEYFPGVGKFLFTLAKEKKDGHRVESLGTGDYWLQDILTQYQDQKPNVNVTPEDLCLFQYTGGTTGVSKAAMSTHAGLVANTLQICAPLQPQENEIFMGAIPMFHVFGMVAVLSVAVYLGDQIILSANARDITDVVEAIDKYKPTLFHGVPALYNAINNHELVKSGKISLKTIRACVSGSAPLPPATKREFERLSGGKLLEGFGMSEAPTASHVNPVFGENRAGSIGLPLADVDVRIVSLDDGETEIPVGELGEMVIAGPQVMRGYHGMPTETANALRVKDGKTWLYTGDIARMDEDGYFYVVDRKKDMALIGGFNVYPASVEKVIKDHPAVFEVGVAAIPHPAKEGEEALKAWVVLKPDHHVTADELIDHCIKYLARYEVPTRYAFVDELPKTAVGKTLRRELVRIEMEDRERAIGG